MTKLYAAGLALAALGAAWGPAAADAPRAVQHDTAVLERGQLARLAFDSRVDDRLKGSRQGSLHDVALDLMIPRRTYYEGEPIPAYLVLRSRERHVVSVDARLDLFRPDHRTVGACALHLRQLSGRPFVRPLQRLWARGGSVLRVPASGYYCVRADLARLGAGGLLPPGRYAFSWDYARQRSREVRFEVRPRRGAAARPAPPRLEIRRLNDRWAGGVRGVATLRRARAAGVAAALAVGIEGRWYPDIHAVPHADGLLRIDARVEGRQLVITLRTERDGDLVRFSQDDCRLFIVARHTGPARAAQRERVAEELAKAMKQSRPVTLVDSHTMRVRLPADWRKREGIAGAASLSVLMTSDRAEMHIGGKIMEELRKARVDDPKRWRGALMSRPFVPDPGAPRARPRPELQRPPPAREIP